MQDTNAADIYGKYMAFKHDIVIIGHDGTVRVEFRGASQLDPSSQTDQMTFKNAVIAAMP